MQVFLDESGYTGEDLANQDQPLFVLASTRADDSWSAETYRKVFAGVRSPELRHTTLVKTETGRRRILEFLTTVRGTDLAAVWVVHKEFCLLTKLVDLWLEPALYKDGVDFYDRGQNLAFCNMAWFCLRTFESAAFLRGHLARFQRMVRDRTRQSYQLFWQPIYQDSKRCRKETKQILDFFLAAEYRLGYEHLLALPERSLEISLTSAIQTVSHWRKGANEVITVVHDNSSTMAREKWIWDAITSPDVPAFRVGHSGGADEYPLRVGATLFADSSDHLQLQYADLLAGATVAWARSLLHGASKTHYAGALKGVGIEESLIGGIWPVPKVEPMTPEPGSITVNEYIDFAARVISNAAKRRDPNS